MESGYSPSFASLGIIFFAHGAQKLLGWFGGAGYAQTMRVFREQLHLPLLVALFAILVEFFGGFCLILGFHLLAIALALIVVVKGSGALSVDRILYEHVRNSSQAALANQISLLT